MNPPYCVYAHFCDDRLIYIGSGTTDRAFHMGQSRKRIHVEMMSGKTKVLILGRFECRDEAFRLEREMLRMFLPPANIQHVSRTEKMTKARTRDMRPIKCIETGVYFYGSAHAAREMCLSQTAIQNVIQKNRITAGGYRFEKVDWGESGLSPELRMMSKGSVKSAGIGLVGEVILELISEAILNNEPAPTYEGLAFHADCTGAAVSNAIKTLLSKGYINRVGDTYEIGAPYHGVVKRTKKLASMAHQAKSVLSIFKAAAVNNEPCPSNADIAEITGSRPAAVGKIASRMNRKGLIKIEMCPTGRIVHVDGYSTKPTANLNIKGVATLKRTTRARDYMLV